MIHAVAGLGWSILRDMGTLLRIAAGIVIAGTPLFLARYLTDYAHLGASIPQGRARLAYLLAAQGVALMISGWIVMRLYLRKPKE